MEKLDVHNAVRYAVHLRHLEKRYQVITLACDCPPPSNLKVDANLHKGFHYNRSLLKPGTGRDSDGISRPVPATKTRDETHAEAAISG